MKRYCKSVDITDIGIIRHCVYKCLRKKMRRRDTYRLLSTYCNIPKDEIWCNLNACNYEPFQDGLERLSLQIQRELREKKLDFPPIYYHDRMDNSCLKVRTIGVQDIKQQIFDYIAVEGLRPILRRIGEYQCASIPGRGQLYGVRAIQRWIKQSKVGYACKLDIRHCFESISRENMMAFLHRYVANNDLLWLVDTLLSTFKKGLSIGSFLSQYLCNLYMSQAYHFLQEQCFTERHHKDGTVERIRLCSKTLIYMDDILLLGDSAKHLHKAVRLLQGKVAEMGLELKPNWRLWKREKTFIDIMGVRIYSDHVTIRRRVFRKVRKAYKRASHKQDDIDPALARRCVSYYGLIKHTNSRRIERKFNILSLTNICRKVVSNEGKVHPEAAGSYYKALKWNPVYSACSQC